MFVRGTDAPIETVDTGVTRQVLGHDSHLMAVRVTFKAGAVGYVHTHPHRQVTYVESGTFDATLGEERQRIGPGDTYFVPPGLPHGVVALSDGVLLDIFSPAREDFLK